MLLGVGLLPAALERRWGIALSAGAAAAVVFVGWEGLMLWRYDHSQFLLSRHRAGALPSPVDLITLIGSLAPALGLLALAALGCRRRKLLGAAALPTLAVLALPAKIDARLVFVPLGLAVVAGLLVSAAKLLRRPPGARGRDRFVVAWLACEAAGFFAMSPFPAARRVIGLWIAALFMVGRLASGLPALDRPAVAGIALWSAALGLLYATSDLADADALRRALYEAEDQVRATERATRSPAQPIWFVGHWGWKFYAEGRGMRAVVPDVSQLSPGEWLLVPQGIHQQRIRLDPLDVRPQPSIWIRSAWPWSTLPWSYIGALPLRARLDPHDRVLVYRVERAFVPAGAAPAEPSPR